MEAAAQLGYPEVDDLQNLDNNNAVERYLRYVGPNGRRSDAAHTYIHPKLRSGQYPNLHVLVEKQVIKVLFDDDKRAVGVQYQSNPKFLANPEYLNSAYTSPRTIRASKMVILSAGAIGTPLILERSGVGDAKILKGAGVPVVEDLPGVGNDYQDHHLTLYAYRTDLSPRETINGFSNGRFDINEAISRTDELLGTNAMDARESPSTSCVIVLQANRLIQRANSVLPRPKSRLLDQSSRKLGTGTLKMQPTDLL